MSSQRPATNAEDQDPRRDMVSEYLLLIRNTAWQKDFAAAEIEKAHGLAALWGVKSEM